MDLRALAEVSIQFAINQLKAERAVRVTASVFGEDEEMRMLVDTGTLEENDFVLAVQQIVKETRATAVCFLGDAFLTVVTSPEGQHRINCGERFSPAELVARKWAKRREAIVCTVESPNAFAMFHQFYRRNGEGAIILEDLEQKTTTEHTQLAGTDRTGVFRFFEQAKETVH